MPERMVWQWSIFYRRFYIGSTYIVVNPILRFSRWSFLVGITWDWGGIGRLGRLEGTLHVGPLVLVLHIRYRRGWHYDDA